MVLVILYLTNAVNLTDGVDGLCGTVTLVAMLIFTLVCSKLQMEDYTLYTMALAGGCLGFLVWNLHPAKCFMGDTGSMYLGASVAAIGLATHQHLTMILVALVYILEALSVMIQVTYFKYTKKKYGEGRRIFKMTPIHHHFEMSGFSEYKIVITFSLFGAIAGLCGLLLVTYVRQNQRRLHMAEPKVAGTKKKMRFSLSLWQRNVQYGEVDLAFFLIVIALLVMGIVMMFSASYAWAIAEGRDGTYYAVSQIKNAVVGLVIMCVLCLIDYHFPEKLIAIGAYVLPPILLVMVFVPGIGVMTAVRPAGSPLAALTFSLRKS